MKRALRATLVVTLALGCGTNEQSTPQRESEVSIVANNLAARFDSTATPDTAVFRTVARVESLPHNGEPGDARSRVTFADSATLEVPIRSAKLLLELPVPGRASWLLFSGNECSECDANASVWVFRATPGRVTELQLGFVYPGALTEVGLGTSPYFRSRLFLGACLDQKTIASVWLEEVLQPDSARARRVRILESTPTLADRVIPWTDEVDARIQAHVAAGRCREVPPSDQYVA